METRETIERRELHTFPTGTGAIYIYKYQPKAWFSASIMLKWVVEYLAAYVATAPPGCDNILRGYCPTT